MATIIGRNLKVAISDDDITYVDLGRVLDGSLDVADDIADETTNDSGGFKEGKYADSQATLDVTLKYDSANAGQINLINAKTAKQQKFFRFRPEETSGELEWRFKANIPSLTVDTSTGEVEEMSATMESTGTITKATQA